ncbi:MAG TPA: hypothetical protein VGS12_03685 [Caulobacteraceae bacterium]|nr:hypothetical protein [Caulobacteraceae bacterium]
MSNDAVLEAIPAERFRTELTRKVIGRLPSMEAKSTAGQSRGSPRRANTVKHLPDAEVVIDGERFLIEAKATRFSGRELLEAVHAAVGDLVGTAKVFIVHDSDLGAGKVVADVLEQLPAVVARRRQALRERDIEALVDVFLGGEPLAAAMPSIERDNASAQAAFLDRWPVLTADAVAEAAEHGSTNRSATASRWKKSRRIFGMRAAGREVYPAFQFTEGRPRPVIARVLAALPEDMTGWQAAFWFTSVNGWLDGKAPLDRLGDASAVVSAAQHERDEWMG